MPDQVHHVKLRNAPLKRMVCQLRYPPELGFDASVVRPLQKQLADEYPTATSEQAVAGVTLSPDGKPLKFDIKNVFRFAAEDRATTVQVTDDFIAFETSNYSRFPDFADRWRRILSAAVQVFELRKQQRLGLRYTNVIEQPSFKTAGEWKGSIRDHLLSAVIEVAGICDATESIAEQSIVLQTAQGTCLFRHGFPAISTLNEPIPQGYVLDIDSYDEGLQDVNIDRHMAMLDAWNHQSYQLLRGAVSDELWASFEPEESP